MQHQEVLLQTLNQEVFFHLKLHMTVVEKRKHGGCRRLRSVFILKEG